MRRSLLTVLACCAAALTVTPAAHASGSMDSTFQDDPLLVYGTNQQTTHAMDVLKALGVDRVRISVFWNLVAPAAGSYTRPEFDASDPAQYPAGAWDRYDRILLLAQQRGIKVNFNVTGPGPYWAMGKVDRTDLKGVFDPNAQEYGAFVRALATRYSGTYIPGAVPGAELPPGPALPRVDYWSIWNEPNQPGWLVPQWAQDPRAPKDFVETAPRIYRDLFDAAFEALADTGHAQDTILIGETAPKGAPTKIGQTRALKPARFIRQLYCLDDNFQFLQGTSAELRGCPVSNQAPDFVKAHPGLFAATGWAHHPYELTFSPHTKPADPEYFTIANLPALQKLLGKVYQRYGQAVPGNKRSLPLYLTEFGYQTNPPDPTGVSPANQAAYINEAEYLAWRNASVRTLSQFLLVDDKPVPGKDAITRYGSSFQSGLMFLNGTHKPAYAAYQLPIFLPKRRVHAGSKLRIWGDARLAPKQSKPSLRVEARGKKGTKFRKLGVVHADSHGFISATVTPHRTGALRLAYKDAAGAWHYSRGVTFTVVARKKAKKR